MGIDVVWTRVFRFKMYVLYEDTMIRITWEWPAKRAIDTLHDLTIGDRELQILRNSRYGTMTRARLQQEGLF